MAVGYSLGNKKDVENDILVLGEDDPSVITYSSSTPIPLTRMCRNQCPYCGFRKRDNLIVPYSTIRIAKMARARGIREGFYVAGERPDKYSHIRSLLDLWGFGSYLEYLYTVCELGFLEGLIPVLEMGFLTPQELKRLREIAALLKIMFDSVDDHNLGDMYANSPGKKFDVRLKSLDWACKLGIPVITGPTVGIGETKAHRRMVLNHIAQLHEEYGLVHEVLIQPFVPQKGTLMEKKNAASDKNFIDTIELARSILPDDVPVTVPMNVVTDLDTVIKAGVRDLGRLYDKNTIMKPEGDSLTFEDIASIVEKNGFTLQQRFPLRKHFIKEGMYSKKLGQVFDAYRYRVKKEGQEKTKPV